MTRLAVFSTMILALSAAPVAAANCFWSNGAYKCYDRAGRVYVTKPRVNSDRAYRRPQESVRRRTYAPVPESGSGMGSFTYSCTLMRCD